MSPTKENDPGATRAPGPVIGQPPGTGPDYLMKRISAYFGSGHRSSGTIRSSLSATARVLAMAGSTVCWT